ncbi:MAG: hypothetical protein K1X92_18655, partial [Bacteroidia bacterium]|nr:hypothetical protein [Bacteroidia bacterium]
LNFWLIGYSLGGRIAMFNACQKIQGLKGVIVEGGHLGVQDEEESNKWRVYDRRWAESFCTEPMDKVFTDWYQQNFSTLFTYEDIKGGADKVPFQVNWDGVNGALKELGKCPEFDPEFFENEKAFYKKWEEKWKKEPETQQIPDVFQRDRYLCSSEPDMIFSLLEKAQTAVAVNGETATALIVFENGTRLPFELKKREGRWKITRIICE